MSAFEYVVLKLDLGDLSELNRLALAGFHVVAEFDEYTTRRDHYVLLEREMSSADRHQAWDAFRVRKGQ